MIDDGPELMISSLLITLSFSFCFQITVIILYLSNRLQVYYRLFLGTFIINTILMIVTTVIIFRSPQSLRAVDLDFIVWIISGLVLIVLLFLKATIVVRIMKRTKDPEFYSVNFFGKKVYEKGIVKPGEFATITLTMPFFLMIGAYFVARLLNFIYYGKI